MANSEIILPEPIAGYVRQWTRCKECGALGYYDHLPYQLEMRIHVSAPCRHYQPEEIPPGRVKDLLREQSEAAAVILHQRQRSQGILALVNSLRQDYLELRDLRDSIPNRVSRFRSKHALATRMAAELCGEDQEEAVKDLRDWGPTSLLGLRDRKYFDLFEQIDRIRDAAYDNGKHNGREVTAALRHIVENGYSEEVLLAFDERY